MSSPASDVQSTERGKGTQVEDWVWSIHLGSLPLALLTQCSAGNDKNYLPSRGFDIIFET